MIIGYARVSTEGQTLEAQQAALAGAGAEKVFAEKVSGAVTDRKALAKAIASLVTWLGGTAKYQKLSGSGTYTCKGNQTGVECPWEREPQY
jgi:hypothetical protein